MQTVQTGPTRHHWFGVAAAAAGVFTLVTSEMLPVGILPAVAAEMGVTDGTVGLMVTAPGLVAAAASPLLMLAIGRLDRRIYLCLLMTLLAVANLVTAAAPSFPVLLGARLMVGLSIGGFWALAGSLAPRLVPPESVGRAMALIFGGVAAASVLGVPAGTLLGDLAGWRLTFVAAAALAAVVLVGLALSLPRLPATQPVRLASLPAVLRIEGVRVGILSTALLVTGHFAAYTFVNPILQQLSGIDAGLVSSLLLIYGVAGIVGNIVAGGAAVRDVRRTLIVIIAALSATLLLMPLLGTGPVGGIAMLVLWGLSYGGVSVSLQTLIVKTAPRATEAASSLFAGTFNLSIALGALIGGWTVDGVGPASVLWLGGGFVLLTAAVMVPARIAVRA